MNFHLTFIFAFVFVSFLSFLSLGSTESSSQSTAGIGTNGPGGDNSDKKEKHALTEHGRILLHDIMDVYFGKNHPVRHIINPNNPDSDMTVER